MNGLLPELEEYLATVEVPDGTAPVNMHIHAPTEEIVRSAVVKRKYAHITQTTLNIIGIRVTITERSKESV